jgi:formylglycine-generating enzyme required for sulfatase activity
MPLDRDLFKACVDILVPHVNNSPRERQAFVGLALYGSVVLTKIEWTGDAATFAPNLVAALDRFDGTTSLVRVLHTLRDQVGEPTQSDITTLIARLAPSLTSPGTVSSAVDGVRAFISYARADGADASLRLYNDLQAKGIGAWRDNRIDPTADFTGEIEDGINNATHVVVVVTPDLKRADSFVRLEIGYALTQKKPIIPLVFPGGHRPITIINHTYISFADWDAGFAQLLQRLKNPDVEEIDPKTRREREIAYLQAIGQNYDHWRDLYTDMAATARIEEQKVKLKAAAARMIEMRHAIHQQIDHSLDAEKGLTVKTESLDELREGLRNYRRVALIGDPGAGKTTTLERLAYEYATTAAEEAAEPYRAPLPLFVRLGAYTGDDFTQFLEASFGGLRLSDYLPNRVVLLLDGLNEMPPAYHRQIDEWLRDHPDAAVMVSCRKLDYVERKLPLQRVDVQPLDLERIRLFMGNYLEDEDRDTLFWALAGYDARRAWAWYQSRVQDVTYREFFTGEDTPGFDWIPERKLLDKLRRSLREQHTLPDMLGVVTNPFLLQIVIEIFALSGEPPRNKGDLFGRFVALLLEERGKTAVRADRVWIAEETQKRALAALAYRMQSNKTGTSVGADFVLAAFRQAVPEADAALLLYFAVSASILEQTDTVRFSHQLLQEYFAAYEMGEDLRRGVPASKYFPSDDWWTPTGWEETALLLAGMLGDATKVVEWLTPVQPDLAYRVATESGAPCSKSALQALYEPAPNARRSPYAVAEWGRLNHEHDHRPGVGVIVLPSPHGEGQGVRLPDIAWCDVPAGKFLYGQDKQEREIKYPFKIAKYPVTFIQFQAFLDSGEYDNPRWWVGMPNEDQRQPMAEQYNPYRNHPRDRVSWYQAVAFSRWLNAKYRDAKRIGNDVEIRLPLETEWEYAARGSDGREYPWGDGYRVGHANLNEQEWEVGPYFLNRTTAVGNYPQGASPFGVYDMAGTIGEWCLNDYIIPEIVDGYNNDKMKVLRGGSFINTQFSAAASLRSSDRPHGVFNCHGLRLVVAAPISAL